MTKSTSLFLIKRRLFISIHFYFSFFSFSPFTVLIVIFIFNCNCPPLSNFTLCVPHLDKFTRLPGQMQTLSLAKKFFLARTKGKTCNLLVPKNYFTMQHLTWIFTSTFCPPLFFPIGQFRFSLSF